MLVHLRSLLAGIFRRSSIDGEMAEMEEEFRAHLRLRADDLMRSGLTPAEAERRALIEFGGRLKFREEGQEARGGSWLDTLGQDVRFSWRVLRQSPGFTAVAVLTLALAIGANAVVFAALNAFILRPLNLPRAESLYSIHRTNDNSGNHSYPSYLDFRDRNRSFEDLAAYQIVQAGLDTGDRPTRDWVVAVSGNYFNVLGVQPALGRLFGPADERGPNSAPYVVLAHTYWQSRFQADPGVVGRVVRINKQPYTIVGVAPQGFTGTLLFFAPDFFVPMVNIEHFEPASSLNSRSNKWIFLTMGHLKAGVTPEQAAADLNAVNAYLEKTYPKDHGPAKFKLARPSLYGEFMGGPVRAFVTALMLLAGLILLAACANLGSLFSARAADRAREVALRLALGASRARIMRQLLTDALLIALAGGAIGLWGSVVLLGWIRAWQPFPQFPINIPLHPDENVYIAALVLALASGILFGLAPIRQVLRTDPYEIIKAGSRATPHRWIGGRDGLVAVQIALCAVLVTSALVAVRGLAHSLQADFGFDPRNAILVETVLDMAGYRGEAVPAMQKRMIEAMESVPGVSAAGLVDWAPLSNGSVKASHVFTDETTDLRPARAVATSATYRISPGYLRAAGTGLLKGRDITWHDDMQSPRVALITQEFARRLFGSNDRALGRYYKVRDGSRIQIVGVIEDGKFQSLTEDTRPAMFFPILQAPISETSMVVRTTGDPRQVAGAVRDKMRHLDPGLPAYIQTWDEGLNLVLFPARAATVSLGILGLMGAMLSVTGIFGMAAYSVSRRLKELGIRIALGANSREVLGAALSRAFQILFAGSAAGIVLGLLGARVLSSIVYQATPRDPLVLAAVVLFMLMLGLIATWIPARRALSADPLKLLREE